MDYIEQMCKSYIPRFFYASSCIQFVTGGSASSVDSEHDVNSYTTS